MRKYPPLVTSKGEWSHFSVYSLKDKAGSVGIAIPRTLFPKATARNRLRRQIREALRLIQNQEGDPLQEKIGHHDLLLRVRQRVYPTFGAIQKEVKAHLRHSRFLL